MAIIVSQRFLEVFPEAFLVKIPYVLNLSYAEAERMAAEFDAPEAHDLRPIVRRAYIEQGLRAIAHDHGLVGEARLNDVRNSYHTFVELPPFCLTESAVSSPETIVRPALFREAYSLQNENFDLFEPARPVTTPDTIYGIVLHGPHPKEQSKPGFAWVRFPEPGFESYFSDFVNLQQLAEGRRLELEVPQSEIEDQVAIQIAEHVKRIRQQREG